MTKSSSADLRALIDSVVSASADWFLSALHPLRKSRHLLAIDDEAQRWKETSTLWGVSFFLSVIVNLALYHPYGIELTSVGFHLSCLMCFSFTVIACSGAIQLSLKLYGIDAEFVDVSSIYVSCFACYQPLIALLSYPSYLHFLSVLSTAKHEGFGLVQTAHLLIKTTPHSDCQTAVVIALASTFCSCILLGITCVSSALMIKAIADHFAASKLRIFQAFAFANAVLVPVLLILQGMMIAFVEFRFL